MLTNKTRRNQRSKKKESLLKKSQCEMTDGASSSEKRNKYVKNNAERQYKS